MSSLEETKNNIMSESSMRCPKCKSTQLHIDKRGFKAGRALAGGVLTGNIIGAVASGGIGMNKVEFTCLRCGHTFGVKDVEHYTETPYEEDVRVVERDEGSNKLYRCDCGRECSIPYGSHHCPTCGRYLSERHIIVLDKKGGCLAFCIAFVIISSVIHILL